ncbi:hypothetical protein J3D64_004259 [Priestia megaterium]|nr:hypothetical protein [Priestia megaterium]
MRRAKQAVIASTVVLAMLDAISSTEFRRFCWFRRCS